MKRLRPWLLPVFTILIVLTVTLLPQHLSNLQDQKLMGRVHTEALTAENSLPIQSPDLVQRMVLLSRWMETSDVMSAQSEVLEGNAYEELYTAALAELKSLADDGPLPSDLIPLEAADINIVWMYLQQQLVGAEFYVFEAYIKTENIHLWMVLDGETMDMLWLELGRPALEKYYEFISPAEIGVFILDRLGIENDLKTTGEFDAVFQISEADLQYRVSLVPYFRIRPTMVYPETDAEGTDSYAIAEYGTMMQNRGEFDGNGC